MGTKRAILVGVYAGLVMGVTLFIVGAIASRIIYGPQFAPAGKFEPGQLNAWYFIWTKLLIGVFFGVLFSMIYEKLPLSRRIDSVMGGLKYAFWLWLVIYLWSRSHPLVYGTVMTQDQLFWLIYSLGGFLGFGTAFGHAYRRFARKAT